MATPLVLGSSMGGLRPNTGGVMFTPRDILKTSNGLRTPGSRASRGSFEYGRLEERAPSRGKAELSSKKDKITVKFCTQNDGIHHCLLAE